MSSINVRKLEPSDISEFLESLDALRPSSAMSKEKALTILGEIQTNPNHHIFVALKEDHIVGTATLLIERKFIHDGGLVGHIEDVAVHKNAQRTGIGSKLVEHLSKVAKNAGCYKVILDCEADLVGFYERLGFSRHSVSMKNNFD